MAERICFWLDESMSNPEGRFVPILVTENEAGYNPTNYDLPGDFATAQAVVGEWNTELGVTPKDARDIVASSMRLGNVRWP
jgi:hypothetical protein